MKLFRSIKELQQTLAADRIAGLTIGFVPTMGALHLGHLSLVERAGRENDRVVVSIFVNPTQFNDPHDLRIYPRTLDADMALLSGCRCDYVFAPSVEEIYPEPDTRKFDFGSLGSVMEGHFRPGHFNGVAQVVSRLFDLVKPGKAYFGLKDFQQYSIIKNMCLILKLPIGIVACDIVREADGLAMSSRNALLTPEHRAVAPQIYSTLQLALKEAGHFAPDVVKRHVADRINSLGLLKIEYFEIVDELTLKTVSSWKRKGTKVGCIAVFAGKVRLIDNIIFAK
ncbi:MAG: pantoate--beta-alanine ligase [Prolixibacteraceae bacterium]|jgi:pantoate--beta-alanine ligase|nr:pantoate--beta-alanine ligase [Prolixibacteraceae bacterium]